MKNPSLSIIVAVYNIEKWLPVCIDSLLRQTYKDFQLILADDGSTDNSARICDEYATQDNRIEAVHQKNGGLSRARNIGIELAKGDFFCFVDGDDFCEEDMLKTAMESFSEEIDIVAFGFYKNSKKIVPEKKISENFDDALKLYIAGELSASAWGKIYRKCVFDKRRFPEGKLFEDMWIFPEIAKRKILLIDKALYHYVQRENSITTTKFKPEYMDFLESLNNWQGDKNLLKIVRLRVAWNLLLFMENEHNEVYTKLLVKILREEKKRLVPIKGFVNFILANLLSFGFSYSKILHLRYYLKQFKYRRKA
jgi:glycosyltransferase involved in cell wall biosynthesis